MSGKRKSQAVYRIGEAARILALKTCVLRFWEGEFPQLAPVRTPKGQRLYTEQDITVLRRIRCLLHEQGMTIEGARRVLAGEMSAPAEGVPGCCPVQGSLIDPVPEDRVRAGTATWERNALAAAAAELESLRGLLLTTPTPLDSPPAVPVPLSSPQGRSA